MEPKSMLFTDICVAARIKDDDTKQYVLEVLNKYNITVESASFSFADTLDKFINAKTVDGLSQKTLDGYHLILTNFDKIVNKAPADITTDDLRSYLTYESTVKNLKKSSVQTHINVLRSFYDWMCVEEMIQHNPMSKIKNNHFDKKHAREPLSQEEIEISRNHCASLRDKALFELLVSTGCRVSEIVDLPVSKINFAEQSIEVFGKGSKTRTVYFSACAKIAILNYLADSKNKSVLFTSDKAPYSPIGSRSIELILNRIGQESGIDGKLFPHRLRHTFASTAVNRGMDIVAIQQLLGHENLNTTQIYAQMSQESVKSAYSRLSA